MAINDPYYYKSFILILDLVSYILINYFQPVLDLVRLLLCFMLVLVLLFNGILLAGICSLICNPLLSFCSSIASTVFAYYITILKLIFKYNGIGPMRSLNLVLVISQSSSFCLNHAFGFKSYWRVSNQVQVCFCFDNIVPLSNIYQVTFPLS